MNAKMRRGRYTKTTVGVKIARLRKAHGWTQEELAGQLERFKAREVWPPGTDVAQERPQARLMQSRIAKWETGEGKPDQYEIVGLADATGTPVRFWCLDEVAEPDDPRCAEPNAPGARPALPAPAPADAPAAPPPRPLPDALRLILKLVEAIGEDEAVARLSAAGQWSARSTAAEIPFPNHGAGRKALPDQSRKN